LYLLFLLSFISSLFFTIFSQTFIHSLLFLSAHFINFAEDVFAVSYAHELVFVLFGLLDDFVALFVGGFLEGSLDDVVAEHVFHEVDDHARVLVVDDAVDQTQLVLGGPFAQTHLHHVGTELLVAQVQQVLAHHRHHLVLPSRVAVLHDVLDDLIALLVLSQNDDLIHYVVLDEVVQETGGDALNHLLDHAAAQRVHAEFVHVGADLVEQPP